jgi:hypothetical protein
VFIFKLSAPSLKYPIIMLALSLILATGCSTSDKSNIPADFFFVMDVQSADNEVAQNINIRINGRGEAEFEIYETGGTIRYDQNDMVIYDADRVVGTGKFDLSDAELEKLWNAINDNKFFELTEDYRMAIGHSYAFIMIEANGQRHQIDNIGMEVPEIKALVEVMNTLMPAGVNLEYGEGYVPQS